MRQTQAVCCKGGVGCRGRGERGKAAQVIRRESRRGCSRVITNGKAGKAEREGIWGGQQGG